jgi:carbamate kinase
MRRVVVVLGGNAFAGPAGRLTMSGQLGFAHEAATQLAPLLTPDVQLLLSHGNGPQVGHILTRVEEAIGKAYAIPLEVCVAESEGEIGYVLAQALHNVLADRRTPRAIASMLTQVVVAEDDPAHERPTKPIGPWYPAETAAQLRARGLAIIEEPGRGARRVVPSPEPLEVIELDVVRALLDAGVVPIVAGGGGIPVIRRGAHLQGIEAVIDKDRTAALIANAIDAELLVILTNVPCAFERFATSEQTPIGRVAPDALALLLAEGHFAPGSMQPKVEAALRFASRRGRRAIICDPPSLADALDGNAGTIVMSGP